MDTADIHVDTEECLVDLGAIVPGKAHLLLLVTINQCVHVENTLCCSAAILCACEIIHLFSVVFRVVRALHKFDFGFVINAELDKRRPAEIMACSYTDSRFWQICVFSPTVVSVKGLYTHAVLVNSILLSKKQ